MGRHRWGGGGTLPGPAGGGEVPWGGAYPGMVPPPARSGGGGTQLGQQKE